MMKINALTFFILFAASQVPLLLPAVAAEGLPGVTVTGGESATVGQREQWCKDNAEKCRAEIQARQEARFKRADSDGNGALSRAEAGKGMRALARHFDQIDANKDGQITRGEIEAARKAREGARRGTAG